MRAPLYQLSYTALVDRGPRVPFNFSSAAPMPTPFGAAILGVSSVLAPWSRYQPNAKLCGRRHDTGDAFARLSCAAILHFRYLLMNAHFCNASFWRLARLGYCLSKYYREE